MFLPLLSMILALTALVDPAPPDHGQTRKPTAPESFTANAQVIGSTGALAAKIAIRIDRYSPDADRDAVAQALKEGGYPAFLIALRKAPVVGTVILGEQPFNIRWAREQPSGTRTRSIVVITDTPVFFAGGGSVNAKPRKGYDVALLQFTMDDTGVGHSGTMAAAARVRPGGETGVQIDDYAEKPIELSSIMRAIK